MSDKRYVTYEEFGAKGDGVTDDFFAIKAAHDYANENGLPVKACDTATYYIHETRIDGEVQSAIIKTDTSWGSANFIIDDTDISLFKDAPTYPMYKANIFKIVSDYPVEKIEDAETLEKILRDGLNRETKKINLTFDYPVMIIPYNSKHNVYRRKGYGGFNGFVMHEVIVLDKDGNIDKDTPVMFDYKNLDYIEVLRLDIKPITVDASFHAKPMLPFLPQNKNLSFTKFLRIFESAYISVSISQGWFMSVIAFITGTDKYCDILSITFISLCLTTTISAQLFK